MGQYNHLSCPVLDSDRSELNEEEKKRTFSEMHIDGGCVCQVAYS